MKIIEIKDILVSKKTDEFPELIKSVMVHISDEIDGQEIHIENISIGLIPPETNSYIPYENVSIEMLTEWVLNQINDRPVVINTILNNKKQRLDKLNQQ